MEVFILLGIISAGIFFFGLQKHNKRAARAKELAAKIRPEYLHAVAQRAFGLAVEHHAHGRPCEEPLEMMIAIAERIESLSGRSIPINFRLQTRTTFVNNIRMVEAGFGDRIRRGVMTGFDAVDVPDEMGAFLANELGLRHMPRHTLQLPDDPMAIFDLPDNGGLRTNRGTRSAVA